MWQKWTSEWFRIKNFAGPWDCSLHSMDSYFYEGFLDRKLYEESFTSLFLSGNDVNIWVSQILYIGRDFDIVYVIDVCLKATYYLGFTWLGPSVCCVTGFSLGFSGWGGNSA